jgi:hypothetical protein
MKSSENQILCDESIEKAVFCFTVANKCINVSRMFKMPRIIISIDNGPKPREKGFTR